MGEAGDASSVPDTAPADAGSDSNRSPDAGVCKLVGSTCEGAGSGWQCCGVEKGFPFDFDAGCVRRTSVPLGCRSEPLEEGNACAYNAAIGCLMRTRDGGVEAFWTPTDYGGFISADDDVTACTEEVEMAVMGADRCHP